jgi:pilus assembly protein CpaF
MTTIHANSTRDALSRLEAMVGMSGVPLSDASIRQVISRAIQVIVQVGRGSDGRRRLLSVAEITGTEGNTVVMQEIFRFNQRGVDGQGRIVGDLGPTGIRARVMERIERAGIDPAKLVGVAE